MRGTLGINGIDCVSKFDDDSFLTTTTVSILPGTYDEQKLFRVSFSKLNAIELLQQHLDSVPDFEVEHGAAGEIFDRLLAIAKLVDEYTLRQRSNSGHGFLQFASEFAKASVSQMMGDNDDWDDEGYDEGADEIEYNLETVSPLIRAILQNDLSQVRTSIDGGAEIHPT